MSSGTWYLRASGRRNDIARFQGFDGVAAVELPGSRWQLRLERVIVIGKQGEREGLDCHNGEYL